jgi:predicted metalloprotease
MSGNSRGRYQITSQQEENTHEKRRNFALVGGIVGVVALVVYLVVAAYPSKLFSEVRSQEPAAPQPAPTVVRPVLPNSPLKTSAENDFASANKVMARLFAQMGKKYTAPSLQLFEDTISAYDCGQVLPATGAFYCSGNQQVFIDLSFFRALKSYDSVGADRTQAYIIAHQVGHHIEDLLGITAKIEEKSASLSDADAKKLKLKAELLADYYAGVWAHYAFKTTMDNGDAEVAIGDATRISSMRAQNAETAVGDPYNYAHLGQRSGAFYYGYQTGTIKNDGIFEAGELK